MRRNSQSEAIIKRSRPPPYPNDGGFHHRIFPFAEDAADETEQPQARAFASDITRMLRSMRICTINITSMMNAENSAAITYSEM